MEGTARKGCAHLRGKQALIQPEGLVGTRAATTPGAAMEARKDAWAKLWQRGKDQRLRVRQEVCRMLEGEELLPGLRDADMARAIRSIPDHAGKGMDACSPALLKGMPEEAMRELARLMNEREKEGSGPPRLPAKEWPCSTSRTGERGPSP